MSIYDFARDVRGEGRSRRLLVDEDFSWSEVPHRRAAAAVVDVPSHRPEPAQAFPEPAQPFPEPAIAAGSVEEPDYLEALDDGVELVDLRRSRHRFPDDRDVQYEEPSVDDPHLEDGSEWDEASASGRRTIVITGHGAERRLPARQRPEAGLRVYERSGFKPDRIALWAFLLGLALLLGATTSSHAATLVHHLPH